MSSARPDAAVVLHRAAGQTTPGQPTHGHLLQRHLPAPAWLRGRPHRQSSLHLGLGRRRCRGDLSLLGPSRSRPAQQRPQSEHQTGRAALAISLRRPAPSRTRRTHPPSAGNPPEALRQDNRVVLDHRGSQGPTRRTRHAPLGRSPRPLPNRTGRANRPAPLRTDRAQLRRRSAGRRRPRALHRERPERTICSTDRLDRRSAAGLATGTNRTP